MKQSITKWVSRENLEAGMVLGEAAIDEKTGNILIPMKTILTDDLIRRLDNYNVKTAKIVIETSDEIAEAYSRVNESLQEQYVEIETKLFSVFDDVASGKDVDLSEESDIFKDLAITISEENDVITQLQILKDTDDYTFNHSMGVGVLAAKLGSWLGYTEKERHILTIAGIYHDIGKLRIDPAIVNKRGSLTEEEFTEMKRHPVHSYEIVKKHSDFGEDVLQAVLGHHEKLDGSGYPLSLMDDSISKYAKVITVCDIYHALTSNRVYKTKESPFVAASYLRKDIFGKIDPHIAGVFLDNISRFYVGNKVLINDGRVGVIVYIDPIDKEYPIVKIDNDFIDFKKEKALKIVDITL